MTENLTPEQAQALWDAGGFLVLTDLPEGSEFGIDGTCHVVRRFSGIKFVPPGLHLMSWSVPTSSSSSSPEQTVAGPSTIPIRHGLFREFRPRERVVLRYDAQSESVSFGAAHTESSLISDDHLRTLDREMAPYPFEGLEKWKAQITEITPDVLTMVLGDGRIDGLIGADGEEEDKELKHVASDLAKIRLDDIDGHRIMKFPKFSLRRSWRDGAVGEEVTKYAKDKSWLLGSVIKDQMDNEPSRLLANLQLAFVILLHLSSYSALLVYKRFLTLLCQSSSFLSSPPEYLPASLSSSKTIRRISLSLLHTLAAQLDALPEGSFETELPELDSFFLEQIESLRKNLGTAMWGSSGWKEADREIIKAGWNKLRDTAWNKWRWDIDELGHIVEEDDGEEEEGEYAPIVVET
ncbi:hypothetical protein IAR55_001758 [Kwoniella newhampshirensis]|uniref:A1 cistron-splicing factor AAR2 n=1 Tax=Kwoniella newhampshirensis TaxID=1651941 RepID=A0AAW0Z333_9TREE